MAPTNIIRKGGETTLSLFGKLIEWLYLHQKNNLVYTDSLTGVSSRMYYDRVVKHKYQPMAVKITYIDIDNLKHINDINGHNEGSKFIKSIADQLKDCSHLELCRLGGDEFLMVGDVTGIEAIDGISYGSYEKEAYEDVSSAAQKADIRMYNVKSMKSGHAPSYELIHMLRKSEEHHEY